MCLIHERVRCILPRLRVWVSVKRPLSSSKGNLLLLSLFIKLAFNWISTSTLGIQGNAPALSHPPHIFPMMICTLTPLARGPSAVTPATLHSKSCLSPRAGVPHPPTSLDHQGQELCLIRLCVSQRWHKYSLRNKCLRIFNGSSSTAVSLLLTKGKSFTQHPVSILKTRWASA